MLNAKRSDKATASHSFTQESVPFNLIPHLLQLYTMADATEELAVTSSLMLPTSPVLFYIARPTDTVPLIVHNTVMYGPRRTLKTALGVHCDTSVLYRFKEICTKSDHEHQTEQFNIYRMDILCHHQLSISSTCSRLYSLYDIMANASATCGNRPYEENNVQRCTKVSEVWKLRCK